MSYGQQGVSKQELIHLHGLLAEIDSHLSKTEEDYESDLEEYRDLEVRPTSIHQKKTDHRNAVFALAESITDGLGEELEPDEDNPGAACENNYLG